MRLESSFGIGLGHGRQQSLGIGVPGREKEVGGICHFDHLADIHHHHPIADVLHDAEIVGDEDVGQAQFGLEVLQEIKRLGADRHVERRNRLVGHHQLRIERQGAGNADALALAAAEGVRIAPHIFGPQPDAFQEIRNALLKRPTLADAKGH